MIIQQVGEIVPSFRKCRIGARSSPQSRFGFDGTSSGPKHVPEIERRRRISRVAFHEKAIEPFGFGNVPALLGRMRPIEQLIGIVPCAINCQDELTVFVRAAARLLDLNVAEGAGMKPDTQPSRRQEAISGFRSRRE